MNVENEYESVLRQVVNHAMYGVPMSLELTILAESFGIDTDDVFITTQDDLIIINDCFNIEEE